MKKLLFLLLAPVVLAGCSSVTNLTPSRATRNNSGLYHVETKFSTTKRAIVESSIKAWVVSGSVSNSLQRVPLVRGRWEGELPIEAGQKAAYYRFEFDYLYNVVPGKMEKAHYVSPDYGVDLVEKR